MLTEVVSVALQCDRVLALDGLLDQKCARAGECSSGGQTAPLVAVLGGGCVTDSELIADVINRWNLPLVSFASDSFVCACLLVSFPYCACKLKTG